MPYRATQPIGTLFGSLTTTSEVFVGKGGRSAVLADCACGSSGEYMITNLRAGKTTTCGHCVDLTLPKVGDVVGEWTVLTIDGHYSMCQCSCGVEKRIYRYTLGGDSNSCGHYVYISDEFTKADAAVNPPRYSTGPDAYKSPGRTRSKLHRIWDLMHQRCYLEDCIGWKDYGGRGIKINEPWYSSFDSFYDWSIGQGYIMLTGLQIDRQDNEGNYCPSNCRWVDKYVNARNKRNTRWVTAFGETKSLPEWIEDERCSMSYSGVWVRLKNGWLPEKALTLPKGSRKSPVSIH